MPGTKPRRIAQEAAEYLRTRKLNPDWGYDQDIWGEETSRSFTIAGIAEVDLLDYYRDTLTQALADGLTYREWSKTLNTQLAGSGWRGLKPSRLDLIYETNMRVARSVGQWQRIERNQESLPYLQYNLGPVVSRHREEHVAFAGLVLRVDDEFWATHYPPNGYRCKCHVRQVSELEAVRLGISVRPDLPDVQWRSSDGGVITLPYGVEPGWDHNPGKHPTKGLV